MIAFHFLFCRHSKACCSVLRHARRCSEALLWAAPLLIGFFSNRFIITYFTKLFKLFYQKLLTKRFWTDLINTEKGSLLNALPMITKISRCIFEFFRSKTLRFFCVLQLSAVEFCKTEICLLCLESRYK